VGEFGKKTTISCKSWHIFEAGAKTTIPYESGNTPQQKLRFRKGVGTIFESMIPRKLGPARRDSEKLQKPYKIKKDDSVKEWGHFFTKMIIP